MAKRRAVRLKEGRPRRSSRESFGDAGVISGGLLGLGLLGLGAWLLLGRKGGGQIISREQLLALLPESEPVADVYLPFLNEAMGRAQINTSARAAAFLAQVAVESDRLQTMEEYASGEAYNGRADLGNGPNDGPRFKGRGALQLTGRFNYRDASPMVGVDLQANPARAADPDVGFLTAAWVWSKFGLNDYADAGNLNAITRAINCGSPNSGCSPNGVDLRQWYYERAKELFAVE